MGVSGAHQALLLLWALMGFCDKYTMKYIKKDELISVQIQRVVMNGYWEKQIGQFKVSLVPEARGRTYYLVMFVNNHRQPCEWQITSLPVKGNISYRGGYYRPDQESYYVVSRNNGKRRKFVHIAPATSDIGTVDEFAERGLKLRYTQRSHGRRYKGPISKQDRDAMMKQLFGGFEPKNAHTQFKSKVE
jgi:hypothetical protein